VRLVAAHARAATLELARHPAYVVPTLSLPAVFFLLFALPVTGGDPAARMAGFAGFAAIGVAFFQFGVGIAADRSSPWESYLRSLPLAAWVRLTARALSAAAFAAAAAGILCAVAVLTTPVSLPPAGWAGLAAALAAGTAPFALLGTALGYWAPPRAALPLANLLYLLLSYAGGLWLEPARLPAAVARVSPWLPTRALSDALRAGAAGAWPWRPWAALAAHGALFALLAALGYRRDEGRRYR